MIFKSVDFPAPLLPINAVFCREFTVIWIWSSRIEWSGRVYEIFCKLSIISFLKVNNKPEPLGGRAFYYLGKEIITSSACRICLGKYTSKGLQIHWSRHNDGSIGLLTPEDFTWL